MQYANEECIMEMLRPNVLIVDDNPQDIEVMSMHLEEIANVHSVPSGMLAIEYVKKNSIDVILLDVEMPILDGFQTLEYLRKMEECINVPVIMVTSICDRGTVVNSMIMGIDGYLVKPVDKETVQSKVLEVYEKQLENNLNYGEKRTVLLIDDDMSYLKQLNSFFAG